MNYKPFCGYGFFGATSALERAAYFCSWGLMAVAAITGISRAVFAVYYRFRSQ